MKFSQRKSAGRKLSLRERVAEAVSSEPDGTLICALESRHLPHGGQNEVWIVLNPGGGYASRTRITYEGEEIKIDRQLNGAEALHIRRGLERVGAWSLSDYECLVMDGSSYTVAMAVGAQLHVIQMLNPEGEHLELANYIMALLPLPDEHSASIGSDA